MDPMLPSAPNGGHSLCCQNHSASGPTVPAPRHLGAHLVLSATSSLCCCYHVPGQLWSISPAHPPTCPHRPPSSIDFGRFLGGQRCHNLFAFPGLMFAGGFFLEPEQKSSHILTQSFRRLQHINKAFGHSTSQSTWVGPEASSCLPADTPGPL